MNVELFVCYRYLTQRDNNSITFLINVLAIVGITIGVMVLIIVTSTISGFKAELEHKILSIDPHIMVSKNNYCFTSSIKNEKLDNLSKVENVISTNIVVYSQGLLRGISGMSGAIIKSVDFANYTPLHNILTSNYDSNSLNNFGTLLDKNSPIPIVLGVDLAGELGVKHNGIVYLVSPVASNSFPSFVPFKVIAMFKTGIQQYDSTLAYVNISNIQFVSGENRLVSGLEIRVNNAYESAKIAKIIKEEIGLKFLVRDWTQINSNLFSTLKTQKYIMFIATFFIILVAATSVSNALIMAVLSKVNDIIIFKSMGISNLSIGKMFVIRGMFISSLGIVLGTTLGFFICYLLNHYQFVKLPEDVYIINRLYANVDLQVTGVILFVTTIICFISSLFPAYKAYSLNCCNMNLD